VCASPESGAGARGCSNLASQWSQAGLHLEYGELHDQALGLELAVESLRITVLPRASRIDIESLNVIGLQPTLDHFGDELGPVIIPIMVIKP